MHLELAVVVPSSLESIRPDPAAALAFVLGLALLCALYQGVARRILAELGRVSEAAWAVPPLPDLQSPEPLLPSRRTAVLLVSGFHEFGLRSLTALWRSFPGYFPQVLILAVLPEAEEGSLPPALHGYGRVAGVMGMAAGLRVIAGEDPVRETERACLGIAESFESVVFVAGCQRIRPPRWMTPFLRDQPSTVLDRLRARGLPSASLAVEG